jgi:hypothetical protein
MVVVLSEAVARSGVMDYNDKYAMEATLDFRFGGFDHVF